MNKISDEAIAIILTYFIYRSEDYIEDSHTGSIVMNEEFYNNVYKIVKDNINMLINNKNVVKDYFSLKPNNIDMQKYKELIMKLNFSSYMVYNWNDPVIVKEEVDNDYAYFILNGAFKNNVKKKSVFNDTVMKEINIDICNRIYTILKVFI